MVCGTREKFTFLHNASASVEVRYGLCLFLRVCSYEDRACGLRFRKIGVRFQNVSCGSGRLKKDHAVRSKHWNHSATVQNFKRDCCPLKSFGRIHGTPSAPSFWPTTVVVETVGFKPNWYFSEELQFCVDMQTFEGMVLRTSVADYLGCAGTIGMDHEWVKVRSLQFKEWASLRVGLRKSTSVHHCAWSRRELVKIIFDQKISFYREENCSLLP